MNEDEDAHLAADAMSDMGDRRALTPSFCEVLPAMTLTAHPVTSSSPVHQLSG